MRFIFAKSSNPPIKVQEKKWRWATDSKTTAPWRPLPGCSPRRRWCDHSPQRQPRRSEGPSWSAPCLPLRRILACWREGKAESPHRTWNFPAYPSARRKQGIKYWLHMVCLVIQSYLGGGVGIQLLSSVVGVLLNKLHGRHRQLGLSMAQDFHQRSPKANILQVEMQVWMVSICFFWSFIHLISKLNIFIALFVLECIQLSQ